MKKPIGIIKEVKTFSKEIILMKCYALMYKDENGQVIYTFNSKKKRDEFYNLSVTSI